MMVEIKRMGPGDGHLLARVAEDVFDEPVIAERLQAYLAEASHRMVLALCDGVVIGQTAAVLHRHPDKETELYIDEVGVTPAYRRRGIAGRMLAEMIAWGIELGCESAWLGTETDNTPARALYAKYSTAEPIVMYEWDLLSDGEDE